MEIESKKFDKNNIFTIGGNSKVDLVANSESDDTEIGEEEDSNSDIISECIGHIGKWQVFWAALLCFFQFPTTFHIFCLVFQAATKDFWCSRPDHLKSISVELWRNLTQPTSPCSILNAPFEALNATSIIDYFKSNPNLDIIECHSFEFDMSLIGKTIVSEWNLVCGRLYLASVVESCFLAGAGLGSVTSGWISDQYGRKNTLMAFASLQFICGALLGFCNSIELYMILRVIIGFASMAVVVVSFVLVVELVSGKWRTIIGILNIFPVAIAYVICAGISYASYNWRTMQFFITAPSLLLLCLWYAIPESPRWLLSRGRIEELSKLINTACLWNNRTVPLNLDKSLVIPQNEVDRRVSVFDLFQKGYKRTTFLMTVIWFSIILIYFGITLHMSSLGGNVYVNTIIAGSVEAISILVSVLVVLKLGLRVNLFIYMIIAGIACVLINFARGNSQWLTIFLAMIVKCTVGASNAIIPTYTAYQYPVYMRNLGVGAGNFAAGLALVLVPYLFLLEHIDERIPMSIMGLFGVIGAIALLLLNDKLSKRKKQTNPVVSVQKQTFDTATVVSQADAQFDGQLQGGQRAGPGPIRVRKPQRVQQIQQQTEARFLDEAKPVTEEFEDHQLNQFAPQHHSPSPPSPPKALFTSEPQDNYNPIQQEEIPSNAQRFNIERPVPRPQVPQPQVRPQQRAQNFEDYAAQARPQQKQAAHHSDDKPKKPVAQILRKWREENPDGTIVWGFENDDGSFKEETIGIDCITRGIYGYLDITTGEKREYKYETGILCDPDKRDEEEEEEDEVILSNLPHKSLSQAKRPQQHQQQQQQQQQQQLYRN
ncbi:unnamed protein product [Diamesa tonsa]